MTIERTEGSQNPEDHFTLGEGIEDEDILTDEYIEKPYDPTKIRVDSIPMTVHQVMRKIKMDEINLQPDFQRHVIWDIIRQSRLIESMLIRIPLPAFYLDARDDNIWLVVDGLQRLSTLNDFYNKRSLRLKGLEFLAQLDGKNFDELPRNFQRQIEETNLTLYIIKPDTPPEAKFAIFYRINTGGMVLTGQEIRHCLFQGRATVLLKELAESREFFDATTGSINTRRMDDRECVLRYCAFHLKSHTEYKEPDLNKYLSSAMQVINEMDDNEIEDLKRSFRKSMVLSGQVFGKYAFRKMYEIEGYRYPINKALFEVWSVCLEGFDEHDILKSKKGIIQGFIHALSSSDSAYLNSLSQSTGSLSRVSKRFETTLSIIREALS